MFLVRSPKKQQSTLYSFVIIAFFYVFGIFIAPGSQALGDDRVYDDLYKDLSTIANKVCSSQLVGLDENLESVGSDYRLNLSFGGQPLSVGLTNDRVAGLELAANPAAALSIEAFAGLPPGTANRNGIVENLVYGGRIGTQHLSLGQIGLSVVYDNGEDSSEEMTDIDLAIAPWLAINGSSRHTENVWREHRYSATLRWEAFTLSPLYDYFFIEDDTCLIETESHRFGFLSDTDETIYVTGTDLDWKKNDLLNFGIRTRNYTYEQRDEEALYCAGLFSLKASSGSGLSLEIGSMQGERPETLYSLVQAEATVKDIFGIKGGYCGLTGRYIDYDHQVEDSIMAIHTAVETGLTFLDGRVETKVSGIYQEDPYVEDHFTGMLTIAFVP